METPNKQQLRVKETQARLLNAAEEVFVRDGYENAQLDEIAAMAGRSKGAVYTHFKSKEDLFLALCEYRIGAYVIEVVEGVKKCTTQKQKRETFREFYVGLARDRVWPILTMEFKLFALRHPELKERLVNAIGISKAAKQGAIYEQLFGKLIPDKRSDIELSLTALGPIFSGLILESQLNPESLSEKALRRILGRIFDALFPSGS
jgi:AcrR family transcriptional regulator